MIARIALVYLLVTASSISWAQSTCMITPTTKTEMASSRFGKWRPGGRANHGGVPTAHAHEALDFTTARATAPLAATTDGVVSFAGLKGGYAGNAVVIKRDNGDRVAYFHLSKIGVKEGQKVKAGDIIGNAGNTGSKPEDQMTVHLHFLYGVPEKSRARFKALEIQKAENTTFNPGQLRDISKENKGVGYLTDPSPYFCKTYKFNQPDQWTPILGDNTMAQYNKLFGSTAPQGAPPDSSLSPAQQAVANTTALEAQAQGAASPADVVSDREVYGALPSPPLGDYETMSVADMMATEAKRRFSDSDWNFNLVKVTRRALWMDYVRAQGVSNYMESAIQAKKERIEGLLAVYTSLKLSRQREQAQEAQLQATRNQLQRSIR